MKSTLWLAAAAVLMLTACDMIDDRTDGGDPSTWAPQDQPPPPAAAAAPTLTPAGPGAPLAADDQSELQWAASVVTLDELPSQGDATVKLFGAAGGDPAMNGLQTFIAFYVDPAEGWRVFRVGDFLGYRVIGEAPGRVDLEIDESTMDQATGDIGSRTRRLILTWTATGGGAPTAVEAAEAR